MSSAMDSTTGETASTATDTTAEPAETQTTPATTETQTTPEPTETTSTTATAAVASAPCSVEATRTISEAAEVTDFAACSTFDGSLALATEFVGDLVLDTVEELYGNFSASKVVGLTSISLPALEELTGSLYLVDLPAIAKIDVPRLTTLGTLEFARIGSDHSAIEFELTALDTISAGFYIDNTTLTTLDGISLGTANDVQILQNAKLTSITLTVAEVKNNLLIEFNSAGGVDVNLADLVNVGNTFMLRGASSCSLPVLESASIGFTENGFATLDLPKLATSPHFSVSGNSELTTVNVPDLTSVDGNGISIMNNEKLTGTINLAALTILSGGAIDGNYSSVDIPDLTTLNGDISLTSSEDIASTCTHFESLVDGTSHIVKCTYPGTSTSYSSSSGRTSNSDKGAVIGGSVGGVVAFFVIVGIFAVGGYFWWMRRKGMKGRGGRSFGGEGFELADQRTAGRY